MSIGLFPTLDRISSAAAQQRDRKLQLVPESFPPEGVHFHPKISLAKQDGLGCLRGVVTALGIQAAILVLALAIWKLV
jgi:hypothetical protein